MNIPPQHGKSLFIAEGVVPYFFTLHPDGKVIYVSYEAGYAAYWSSKSRDCVKRHGEDLMLGIKVGKNMDRMDWWEIEGTGGYMTSAGAGGPITGKGADLLIIDDPHKNAQEANSVLMQESIFEWYKSTAYTRLAPEGSVILVQTRWNEKDLTGRLLEAAKNGGDEWLVVNLPAIAEEGDALGRAVGEPLWPEGGFTLEKYRQIREVQGSYWFNALYQQKPIPASGGTFKRQYFRYAADRGDTYQLKSDGQLERLVPKNTCRCFQTVDLASSVKTSADYFVIETWVATGWNDLILVDIVRERLEGPDQLPMLRANFVRWAPYVIGIEDVQYQQTMLQAAIRDGLPARALKADRDKFSRALSIAARYEAGTVYHLEGIRHLSDYEDELLRFNPASGAGHDDMVDAAGYAARFLYEGGGQTASSGTFVKAKQYGVR